MTTCVSPKPCTIEGCTNAHRARGYCATHWARWRKFGDPHRVISYDERKRPAEERFWEKVEKTESCWHWTGARDAAGYGVFNLGPKLTRAHRYTYTTLVGPVAEGLHLDHLCRVRHCCNPAHLEPVTPAENSRRGKTIGHFNGPTTCARGHDWSEHPPYLANLASGGVRRTCRVCAVDRARARRASTIHFFAQEATP